MKRRWLGQTLRAGNGNNADATRVQGLARYYTRRWIHDLKLSPRRLRQRPASSMRWFHGS